MFNIKKKCSKDKIYKSIKVWKNNKNRASGNNVFRILLLFDSL